VDHAEEVPAYAAEKALRLADESADSHRRAVRGGVRHVCGTDAGTPFNPHGNAPGELIDMVVGGMTPLAAMRAATANGAELLRLPDVGRIAQGMAADLVLFGSNPVDDIEACRDARVVIRAGDVVRDAR
jgi:imidazolonepropionase-like amidohydrolase